MSYGTPSKLLIRLISSRPQYQEENCTDRSIHISREEIERIQEIFLHRVDFRIARVNVRDTKKDVFILYLAFLVIFLSTIVTYFFSTIEGDIIGFETIISAILFLFLIAEIWDYKNKLIELVEEITEINEDLMTEDTIIPE